MAADNSPDKWTVDGIAKLVVPVLLGAILTYLININSAQTDLGKQLAMLNGQVGVLTSQGTDYSTRLGKLEAKFDLLGAAQSKTEAKVLVLENNRHYK